MNNNLTEIVAILDRSGSMSTIIRDSIGGINRFMEDQRALPGEANITIVLFDDKYELVHDNVALRDVPDFTEATYRPRGMTALYDAVGRAVTDVGRRLSDTPDHERPGKVIVCILTDGEENYSREFNHAQVADLIKQQQEQYAWEFIFLGANIDAPRVAQAMNIPLANAATFAATRQGTQDAYSRMSELTTTYRTPR